MSEFDKFAHVHAGSFFISRSDAYQVIERVDNIVKLRRVKNTIESEKWQEESNMYPGFYRNLKINYNKPDKNNFVDDKIYEAEMFNYDEYDHSARVRFRKSAIEIISAECNK